MARFAVDQRGMRAGWNPSISQLPRSVNTLGSVKLNAKAFGARGDGSTDDTAALQAAVAAAPAGGTVYMPAGTYVHTSAITSTTQVVNFAGDGRDLTILQPHNCDGIFSSFTGGTVKATFRDFTINGSNGATSGIRIGNGSGDVLQSIRVTNCTGSPGHGIWIDDSGLVQSLKAFDIQCDLNAGDGIHEDSSVHSQERNAFIECNCSGNTGYGAWFTENNLHVYGGTYQNNKFDGIRLNGGGWAALWDPVIRTNYNSLTTWAATHAYVVGDRVKPTNTATNNMVFRCEVAGTSAGSEPTWTSCALGATFTDGTVTWRNVGDKNVSGDAQVSCGGSGIYDLGASFVMYWRAADNATRQPILGKGGAYQITQTQFPSGGSPMIDFSVANGNGLNKAQKFSKGLFTNPSDFSTVSLTSGTAYQPNTNVNSKVVVPITLSPTGGADATATVKLGTKGDGTDPTLGAYRKAAAGDAMQILPAFDVPANWYLTVTLVNATFTANASVRNT